MTERTVGEVMTGTVVQMPSEKPLVDAAKAMRDKQIGDVLVTDGERLAGLVTDRDIVIRAIAEEKDPKGTPIGSIVTGEVVTVDRGASLSQVVELMRRHAVRRIVVTENGATLAGIVSIGDLAMAMDPESALSDISAAPASG
jgi:CBS domain-containing protein